MTREFVQAEVRSDAEDVAGYDAAEFCGELLLEFEAQVGCR
jgi:hypothetical protein